MKLKALLVSFLLLAPLATSAAGTLVKSPSYAAVFYLAEDGKRYVFPNDRVYGSWYPDFSGVTTISDAELWASPIGGNVTYKPGVRLVKITTDPKVYAVDKGGVLRWVVGEELASSLFGANWAAQVDDIPDAFFVNYRVGEPILSTSDFNPEQKIAAVSSISADKMLGGLVGGEAPAPLQTPVVPPIAPVVEQVPVQNVPLHFTVEPTITVQLIDQGPMQKAVLTYETSEAVTVTASDFSPGDIGYRFHQDGDIKEIRDLEAVRGYHVKFTFRSQDGQTLTKTFDFVTGEIPMTTWMSPILQELWYNRHHTPSELRCYSGGDCTEAEWQTAISQ